MAWAVTALQSSARPPKVTTLKILHAVAGVTAVPRRSWLDSVSSLFGSLTMSIKIMTV